MIFNMNTEKYIPTEQEIANPPRGKFWKYTGSDYYLCDNPDFLTEDGLFKKKRNKMTNLIPKKRKRK